MMPRAVWVLLLLSACSHHALAQGAAASLNDQQKLGRRLVVQHCSLCHVRASITADERIGPELSRASAGGNDDALRDTIGNGTPRMPGFKLQFDPAQIDAVIAYLKTVSPQPAPAAAPPH
jgi:mono/diheme cytochrome c family protein